MLWETNFTIDQKEREPAWQEATADSIEIFITSLCVWATAGDGKEKDAAMVLSCH